jgi:hypothetical protein
MTWRRAFWETRDAFDNLPGPHRSSKTQSDGRITKTWQESIVPEALGEPTRMGTVPLQQRASKLVSPFSPCPPPIDEKEQSHY